MNSGVLIDAGPLVALFNRRDEHHAWAVDQARLIAPPLKTCEAALAEAMHLLERRTGGTQALCRMVKQGALRVDFALREQTPAVIELMERYADVPMSLADACLVRMCELDDRATLMTTDRDFCIYRKHGRHVLSLIIP